MNQNVVFYAALAGSSVPRGETMNLRWRMSSKLPCMNAGLYSHLGGYADVVKRTLGF